MSDKCEEIPHRSGASGEPCLSEPVQKSASQLRREAKKKDKLDKFKQKQEKIHKQDKPNSDKKKEKKVKEILTYDKVTAYGEKKDVSGPIPDSYSPQYVEAQWYSWWEKSGFFKPEYGHKDFSAVQDNDKFVMVIPPPNVTGNLHLGHALTCAIEDTLTRWNRMCGKLTIWNPGCDHAGIATQVVVEKRLWHDKKKTRHDLGREEFLNEVWKWKDEKRNKIYDQMKLLGCSVDWDRATFTMDPKMCKAVTEAFVRLHDQGLIYRSKSLVNWSCALKSAISDIEVDKIELAGRTYLSVPGYDRKIEFGVLHTFAYEIEDSEETICVATTRIETMLGDTAIAVHPNDTRYFSFHGKYAVHPFIERRMPIILDDYVDMTFGTGAVKITPAHDLNDCEIGKRHNLPFINIMNEDGTLNNECGEFAGMKRFDVRVTILKALDKKKLYKKTQDNKMTIPICNRSKDVIEPMLKVQWYLDVTQMADEAVKAVANGELTLHPVLQKTTWDYWLRNIRNWCISRQLWWGHRIPAYFVCIDEPSFYMDEEDENFYWVSGRSYEEAKKRAAVKFDVSEEKISLKQEEDVLDTWFSSGLFPFAIFGWPDNTPDFQAFYPGTTLETGYDILFFWVARMVMLGQTLTGKLPFREVLLHTIVRDAHGRKMSKSLGNVIDPISVIEGLTLEGLQESLKNSNLDPEDFDKAKDDQKKDFPNGVPECGADALRMGLCNYANPFHDVNLDIKRIEGYRHFCNKLWNGVKFSLKVLGTDFKPKAKFELSGSESTIDLWILGRITSAVKECNSAFTRFDFTTGSQVCHSVWLNDICNVYIEAVKSDARGRDENRKATIREVLYTCLDAGLRLLSPMMPFVTEELFQRLPRRIPSSPPSICVTPYPTQEEFPFQNETVEDIIARVSSLAHRIRSVRADYKVQPNQKLPLFLKCAGKTETDILTPLLNLLCCLTQSSSATIVTEDVDVPMGCASVTAVDFCIAHVLLKGSMDIQKELERLSQEKQTLSLQLQKLKLTVSTEDYVIRVPSTKQEQDYEKMASMTVELEKLSGFLERLKKLSLD